MTINAHLDPEVERRFRAAAAEEGRSITDVSAFNEVLGDWTLGHSHARLAEWREADEESRNYLAAIRRAHGAMISGPAHPSLRTSLRLCLSQQDHLAGSVLRDDITRAYHDELTEAAP